MKKCPFCAEEIQDEAIKCKHCGEMLSGNAPITTNSINTSAASTPLKVDRNFLIAIGLIIMFTGGIAFANYWNMDTSVEVPTTSFMGQEIGGGRVNNIGLMNDKSNGINVSMIATVVGLVIMIIGMAMPVPPKTATAAPASKEIEFTCKGCSTLLKVDAKNRGAEFSCPKCKQELTVPYM